jgi:chaperonin cofactor prefoldin
LDSIEEGRGGKFINQRIEKYEDQHELLEQEIKKLQNKINDLPSEHEIQSKASLIKRMIKN